jgi:hypothetical protein
VWPLVRPGTLGASHGTCRRASRLGVSLGEATTQHYAKITPNILTRTYAEAGYFARNLRTIEVLLGRDAVASGASTNGEPM